MRIGAPRNFVSSCRHLPKQSARWNMGDQWVIEGFDKRAAGPPIGDAGHDPVQPKLVRERKITARDAVGVPRESRRTYQQNPTRRHVVREWSDLHVRNRFRCQADHDGILWAS